MNRWVLFLFTGLAFGFSCSGTAAEAILDAVEKEANQRLAAAFAPQFKARIELAKVRVQKIAALRPATTFLVYTDSLGQEHRQSLGMASLELLSQTYRGDQAGIVDHLVTSALYGRGPSVERFLRENPEYRHTEYDPRRPEPFYSMQSISEITDRLPKSSVKKSSDTRTEVYRAVVDWLEQKGKASLSLQRVTELDGIDLNYHKRFTTPAAIHGERVVLANEQGVEFVVDVVLRGTDPELADATKARQLTATRFLEAIDERTSFSPYKQRLLGIDKLRGLQDRSGELFFFQKRASTDRQPLTLLSSPEHGLVVSGDPLRVSSLASSEGNFVRSRTLDELSSNGVWYRLPDISEAFYLYSPGDELPTLSTKWTSVEIWHLPYSKDKRLITSVPRSRKDRSVTADDLRSLSKVGPCRAIMEAAGES